MRALHPLLAATALVAASVATQASAQTVINFDDGKAGNAVGSTYAAQGVTFSGTSFTNNLGLAGTTGALGIFSTSNGYEFGFDTPIIGTFSGLATRVAIRGIDVGQAGIRLEGYNASNVLVGFSEFFGSGVGSGRFADLTVTGSGIKSFRAFQPLSLRGDNVFGDGVLLDNLSFTLAPSAVPEPATWAMMLVGVGMMGFALRRRQGKVTTNVRFA